MLRFTDIFIKRPVLATVISLLIFLFGLRSIMDLAVRQFPEVENTVITVTTTYPGASADLIQGFITSPIQKSIAGADGVDYINATSVQGTSTIQAYIRLNFDPDKAFTSVMSKVAQVQNQLPQDSQAPVIQKATGQQFALMYIGFNSKQMSAEQITDYISRVVQPKLQTVPGVGNAQILGGSVFAMRVWLDPKKMAAKNVSPNDVYNALTQNNYQSAAGQTKGYFVAYNLNAHTNTTDIDAFKKLIVRQSNDAIVRIEDVADVRLGSESYDSNVLFNGEKAIFVGIFATPDANPLTVISKVRAELPNIEKDFPDSLKAKVAYDSTEYIRASIHEVIRTIIEATLIVILVIFLFIGALRAVLIPVVTIPLSLVGVCSLMLMLGYSINLLTLLAMVLAIGLVVDDAIVVVENIYRHLEDGLSPIDAALQGAREIVIPVIAMTITLAAVYLPIGLMGGLTGALFKEFAFTLASAVIISGAIALTLSPMMCSRLLDSRMVNSPFVQKIDARFLKLKDRYYTRLTRILEHRRAVLLFCVAVFVAIAYLYIHSAKELAPEEDQSVLFMIGNAPEAANIDYTSKFSQQFLKIFNNVPEMEDTFIINGINGPTSAMAGMILKPWGDRKLSQQAVQNELQDKVNNVSGLQTAIFAPSSLPTGDDGFPFQFVLTSIGDYQTLYLVAEKILSEAQASGKFMFIDNSLNYDEPQIEVNINRNKAAEMGITMQQLGTALSTMLGGGYVNRFNLYGQSYQVIPQVARQFRLDPAQLNSIYVSTANNNMVPLGTFITLTNTVQPNSLTQFQQLNSATLQGILSPGVSTSDALATLQTIAAKNLPQGITYDYAGELRDYVKEGNSLVYTFLFALITIYLVLAAQYESFRDPLIVLTSVPMSILGALLPLFFGATSINIYTQVGLITLVGLISKHGILMVDFANHLQITEKLSKIDAIKKAASIRLRPILMTTAAMVLGVFPLVTANGAGAASRFALGIVIMFGMMIGTLFTLYVVPTFYTFIAEEHHK